MPITAFIGVRISWLIVARKALFASLAASAAARASWASLNRRAFWIAITAWSAKVCSRAISLSENAGRPSWRRQCSRCPALPDHRRDHEGTAARLLCDTAGSRSGTPSPVRHPGSAAAGGHRRPGRSPSDRSGAGSRARTPRREGPAAGPGRRRTCTCCCSSTTRTAVLSVGNRASQLSRIFSNTGLASATELLITCSTSAVAVCCSSASLVSLNRRTFSIAITAWSANVSSSAISAWREGARLACAAARSRRAPRRRAAAARRGIARMLVLRLHRADVAGTRCRSAAARRSRGSTGARARAPGRPRSAAQRQQRVVLTRRRTPARSSVIPRSCPPSTSQTRLPSAWHSSRARSATASSTGCTSVGESLMTRRTSAVAVWRSSASLVSLNSRAFWIAITAWSAKVFSSVELLVGERAGRLAQHADRADAAVFPQHRRPRGRVVADHPDHRGDRAPRRVGHRRRRPGRGSRGARKCTRPDMLWSKRPGKRCAPRPRAPRRARRPMSHLTVVVEQEDAQLLASRTGAGSCRGSCRTPARVSATDC